MRNKKKKHGMRMIKDKENLFTEAHIKQFMKIIYMEFPHAYYVIKYVCWQLTSHVCCCMMAWRHIHFSLPLMENISFFESTSITQDVF